MTSVAGLRLPGYGSGAKPGRFTFHVERPDVEPYDGEFSWDTVADAVQDAYDELGGTWTPEGTVIVVFKDGVEFARVPWGYRLEGEA